MAEIDNIKEAKPDGTPPAVPPSKKIELAACPKYKIMSRPGVGTVGRRIQLLSNHFKVVLGNPDAVFYQYSVSITTEDGNPVEGKGIGRKIIDKVCQTYSKELAGKKIAYDGEKCLFTVGSLPQTRCQFLVLLEGSVADRQNGSPEVEGDLGENGSSKRSKRSYQSRTYKVEIAYASKIPLKAISCSLKGTDEDSNVQDALRVLDIVLRQQAANRGCLLVRQSFFHDDSRNFTNIGGGALAVRGFHSSFRPTQGGLSLNMDVSTTMILTPGPVIDFLLANQNVKEPRYIDWIKAKKMLKNLRINTRHRNREWKIIGLSEKPCNQQFFSWKRRGGSGGTEEVIDITVYEYFVKHCAIELSYSAYIPCLDVGKPKRPNYIPLELCSLVSLQRYTKALSPLQRASLVEKSRQKPQERMQTLTDALRNSRYDEDPVLVECGTTIEKQLAQFEGRVLECPKLKVGQNSDCFPRNGRWNFNQKTLLKPSNINRWVIANFSARCDTSRLSRDLIDCGRSKGLHIEGPLGLMEEDPNSRRGNPVTRVEKMLEKIRGKISREPEFILCVLPERKNSELYGPWKKRCLTDFGVTTQCISPIKINDQYLTNVLLKINAKLGGINSLLAIEHASSVPFIRDTPTIILGMDVSHGSPGQDVPSIAAVVGSRCWPLISRYRACVRSQSPKVEMIDALYKPLADGSDGGIIGELLFDFYVSSNGRKPTQIIVFRDGVSESQFNQVLNMEITQIVQAYLHLGDGSPPKFTVIVAQKNHHTKLFLANASENVPPGTVVDSKIVHPRNYDFYMCAQAGMIGTSRPAHYNVLVDEIGFTPDGLQNLVHSLSYVYQRSTTAISIVAPICYAHLAAQQASQFIKFEDFSETSSGQKSDESFPELPRLHERVRSSMFFC